MTETMGKNVRLIQVLEVRMLHTLLGFNTVELVEQELVISGFVSLLVNNVLSLLPSIIFGDGLFDVLKITGRMELIVNVWRS